jgi:hypothetical protein
VQKVTDICLKQFFSWREVRHVFYRVRGRLFFGEEGGGVNVIKTLVKRLDDKREGEERFFSRTAVKEYILVRPAGETM